MVTKNILPILMERDYMETKNITHFGGDGLSGWDEMGTWKVTHFVVEGIKG